MSEQLYIRHQQSVSQVVTALIAAGALLRSLDGMIEKIPPEDWPRYIEGALKGRMDDLRGSL